MGRRSNMLEQQEKLWDFDAVEPGQRGASTVVGITAENIAEYARLSLNDSSLYRDGGLAMPSMVISYAPLLREEIAEANGFVSLEQSKTARRQTPFAKCEIRWSRPVTAGDTITGTGRVLEKYERRGSKFVTFRIEASNQEGLPVAAYDYTCIFDYARGQRDAPPAPGVLGLAVDADGTDESSARLLDFSTATEGLQLTPLSITESQEVINRKSAFRLAGRPNESNIHTDEEFAKQNIFGGTVNSGPATMSYVDQMLQRSFPVETFYNGGKLLMRAITPFRSGDTVTFQGEITAKREEAGRAAVECRVRGINQRGDLVCLADAEFAFV